jgi:serpin B
VGAWDELTGDLRTSRAQVWLPRFEFEWEAVLNDALASLGMGVAFGGGADLSRMFENGDGWIDEVKQKSFVGVDEEGTEAAAATSVVVVESAPLQIRADRPFLFAIRERLSSTILFIGVMVEAPPRI